MIPQALHSLILSEGISSLILFWSYMIIFLSFLTGLNIIMNLNFTCFLMSDPFIELHILSGDAPSESMACSVPTAENFDKAL